MLQLAIPKLPMRDALKTKAYYIDLLGFDLDGDYGDYLLVSKEQVELHFFAFPELDPYSNYGQTYIRVKGIRDLYQELQQRGVTIHPNAPLSLKPWGMQEFALLDPDHNLLTFGEEVLAEAV